MLLLGIATSNKRHLKPLSLRALRARRLSKDAWSFREPCGGTCVGRTCKTLAKPGAGAELKGSFQHDRDYRSTALTRHNLSTGSMFVCWT